MISASAKYPVLQYLPLRARLEPQRQRIRRLHDVRVALNLEGIEGWALTHDPRRMCQQVPNGDKAPGRGRVLKVLRDRVLEGQAALLNQQHDAGRDELLADRANLVHRVRRRRHLSRDIGQTVSLDLDELSVPDHRKRHAWHFRARHLGADVVVHLVCACRRGRDGHESDDERGCECADHSFSFT